MQCLNCLPQWDSCTDWFQFRVCRKLWSCQAGEDVPWDRGAPWRPGSTPSRWASSCTCLTCPCCWARSPRSWGQCGLLWKLHFYLFRGKCLFTCTRLCRNYYLPLNHHLERCSSILDDGADLIVSHLEHLLTIDAPHVVPLLQTSCLGCTVGLSINQD